MAKGEQRMTVFFNNDGSYGYGAVHKPVICCGYPIGFISDVSNDIVSVELWDRYVHPEILGASLSGPSDIASIKIENLI